MRTTFSRPSIRLNALFDDFTYRNFEETKKYTLIGLISNIGGIGGIWVGVSIIGLVNTIHKMDDVPTVPAWPGSKLFSKFFSQIRFRVIKDTPVNRKKGQFRAHDFGNKSSKNRTLEWVSRSETCGPRGQIFSPLWIFGPF